MVRRMAMMSGREFTTEEISWAGPRNVDNRKVFELGNDHLNLGLITRSSPGYFLITDNWSETSAANRKMDRKRFKCSRLFL